MAAHVRYSDVSLAGGLFMSNSQTERRLAKKTVIASCEECGVEFITTRPEDEFNPRFYALLCDECVSLAVEGLLKEMKDVV
jgi:hypothetical protein